MNRVRELLNVEGRGVPRACGDEPQQPQLPLRFGVCFPRVRGDEPLLIIDEVGRDTCSPRVRG